jgi:hypothetical protein
MAVWSTLRQDVCDSSHHHQPLQRATQEKHKTVAMPRSTAARACNRSKKLKFTVKEIIWSRHAALIVSAIDVESWQRISRESRSFPQSI